MKNSIKKVGTTFLGLSCLLGGVLAFTGCESTEELYAARAKSNAINANYVGLYEEVKEQIKLTRTYNVDTAKLYKACMEMIRDFEGFDIYKFELNVVDSDKPSEAGESGSISLGKNKITTESFPLGPVQVYVNGAWKDQQTYVIGYVEYEPTLYIEKGSSENTSVLTIKPRWKEDIHWDGRYDGTYEVGCMYYNKLFERNFANSILDGVQKCIRYCLHELSQDFSPKKNAATLNSSKEGSSVLTVSCGYTSPSL